MLKKVSSLMAVAAISLIVTMLAVSCEGAGVTLSSECDILTFEVGNYSVLEGTNSFTLSVPFGTDISALEPTITLSTGATVSPAGGSAISFTDGVAKTFTVTAEDGSTTKTYTVTVNVTPASADTSFSSSIGDVRADEDKLVAIPAGTTLTDLEAAITLNGLGASFDIFDANGTTAATELNSTKVLIVTAQDGTPATYSLSIAAADNFVFSTTVNYDFDGSIAAVITIADTISGSPWSASVDPALDVSGVITAKTSSYFIIQDSSDAIRINGETAEGVGTRVNVTGISEVKQSYGENQVSSFSNIDQVSTGHELYAQQLTVGGLTDLNKNQLFYYDGFTTSIETDGFYVYQFDQDDYFYHNNSYSDDVFVASIAANKGRFYGMNEESSDIYYIEVYSSDYFEISSAISASDVAGILPSMIDDPEVGGTTLALPEWDGFTIAISTSSDTGVVATDASITVPAVETAVDVTLTVTNDSDSTDTADTAAFTITVPAAPADFASQLYLWEVDPDLSDNPEIDEFIEIWNNTGAEVDFDGATKYFIVLINGSDDLSYSPYNSATNSSSAYLLSGTIASNGVFTIGGASGANTYDMNFSESDGNLQNGADGIVLVSSTDAAAAVSDFPGDSDIDFSAANTITINGNSYTKVDAVVYGTNDSDDSGLFSKLGVSSQVNDTTSTSVQRTNTSAWTEGSITPGTK